MALTPTQHEIARLLADAWARAGDGARIVYRTEWLGYLPYGQYEWTDVEHAGRKDPVSRGFPDGWGMDDLLALERAGRLRRVGETREPADEMHEIVFEMTERE